MQAVSNATTAENEIIGLRLTRYAKLCKINLGCGLSGSPGWWNFDNSPTIWLSRLPLGKKLFKTPKWPRDVRRLNVLKGLPFNDSTVDCIYSSHMFEHLTWEQALLLTRECFRVLRKGGVLRIGVPDLMIAIREYLSSSNPRASHDFIKRLLLQPSVRGLFHPGAHHQQMFDDKSLLLLLTQSGFEGPCVCKFCESRIPDIAAVELQGRKHETLYVEGIR